MYIQVLFSLGFPGNYITVIACNGIIIMCLLQFEGPLVTAVSLYCILNGDDLYETFNTMDTQSDAVKIFSQVYLCIFMFLFIYIVLSLFIGIFNHAYESLSVRACHKHNSIANMCI